MAGLLDWLRMEFGIDKPGTKLPKAEELASDDFVAEVKKRRPRESRVTAAELRRLRDEHAATLGALAPLTDETLELESVLAQMVNAAYGLRQSEVDLLWSTAPPRMPGIRPEGAAL